MSEQIAARIPDELAESLADLVADGRFETKADAVRTALETLVEAERRRRVGALIADGYRRSRRTTTRWRRRRGPRSARSTRNPGDRTGARRALVGEAPDAKGRPYLVLTRDETIPVVRTILVAPVTRTIRRLPPR
jgi:Arc/MetJ-type ribon-helix-helix transcriptional regulator